MFYPGIWRIEATMGSIWLACRGLAGRLAGRDTLEDLQAAGEVSNVAAALVTLSQANIRSSRLLDLTSAP